MAALAHEFLLLGSNRYHRLLLLLQGLGPAVDVLELRLPIRVRAALHGLAVGLETLAQVMEQAVDRPLTHRMPLRLEGRGQRGGTLACPPQERHRVATGHRIDQGFQGTDKVQSMGVQGLASPARTADLCHRSLRGCGRDRVGEFLSARPYGGTG
jgi:hypothetical protein